MRQRDTQLPRVPRGSKASKQGIVRFFRGETSFRLWQTLSAAARMNHGKDALLALPFATLEVTDMGVTGIPKKGIGKLVNNGGPGKSISYGF